MSQETVAAQDMLTRFTPMARTRARIGSRPTPPTGTGSSCNGWWIGASRPICEPRQYPQKEQLVFTVPSASRYQPKAIAIRCPAGNRSTMSAECLNRARRLYRQRQALWGMFAKSAMHRGRYKYLAIHMDETARHALASWSNTPEFAKAQRERKKRWKPCSRNSRIRSDCVACACAD